MKRFFPSLLCIFAVSAGLFLYGQYHQQVLLATALDGYIRTLLPALGPMPALSADVPIGKNAVWWIGGGVEYAGGGMERSTGAMRSWWGGGFFSLPPHFSELDSILIVKGTLAEEKRYLDLPKDMTVMKNNNPFGGPPTLIDKNLRVHSTDEFTKLLRTYGLQVWVVDAKSNRIVAYREFPAVHLQEQYDQGHTPNEVPLNALVEWIESLEKLQKNPALAQKPME